MIKLDVLKIFLKEGNFFLSTVTYDFKTKRKSVMKPILTLVLSAFMMTSVHAQFGILNKLADKINEISNQAEQAIVNKSNSTNGPNIQGDSANSIADQVNLPKVPADINEVSKYVMGNLKYLVKCNEFDDQNRLQNQKNETYIFMQDKKQPRPFGTRLCVTSTNCYGVKRFGPR